MPCYDPRNSPSHMDEVVGSKKREIKRLKGKIDKLEGILCAVMNELDNIGLANKVSVNSSRHGLIDVVGFWNEHKSSDKTRLLNSLHKNYSIDEQKILIELLNETTEVGK